MAVSSASPEGLERLRPLHDFTAGELIAHLNWRFSQARSRVMHSTGVAERDQAARDFSLAITHLEDAATRYNSGRYHEIGTWNRADPDKGPPG